jgi:hypothetical protein
LEHSGIHSRLSGYKPGYSSQHSPRFFEPLQLNR